MKCVLCGGDVLKKKVEEEVRVGRNHVMIKVEAEVCKNCHEKYYSSEVMDKLTKIKEQLGKEKEHLKQIGLVYKFAT